MIAHRPFRPGRMIAPVALLCLASTAVAAEQYSLDLPGNPAQGSRAVVDGNSLTIVDAAGASHVYARTPDFDTPDGAFLGYFNRGANQSLRWPVGGRGKFLIGDAAGRNFRESRMVISPAKAPNVVGANRPIVPPIPRPGINPIPRPVAPPGGGPLAPGGVLPGIEQLRNPFELSLLPLADDQILAAYIDPKGRLQLYQGWNDTWRKRTLAGRFDGLIPGSALAMQVDANGTPIVYTVTNRGELVEFAAGQPGRVLTQEAAFPAAAHLALKNGRRSSSVVAVDDRGRIWEFNLRTQEARAVDDRGGRYEPGSPLAIVEAREDELYLVDRQGSLVFYQHVRGRWEGPTAISAGFQPGGHVSAVALPTPAGDFAFTVGAVDARGQLRVMQFTPNGWVAVPVARVPLTPGAPLAIGQSRDGMHLSAVNRDGVWIDWSLGLRGALTPREIATGFPVAAPVRLYAHDDHIHGLCVDTAGRLVAASNFDGNWHTVLCVPEFDLAPRLISRKVVANEPLPPVQVSFDNNHNEELIVKVIDEQEPSAAAEVRIPPGQSVRQSLKRDAGGFLEERWMIPTPAGQWVEDVRRTEIAPQVKYRLVAYANRTTYQYIDKRKKPGPVANFDLKSAVSLGSFRLPAGPRMNDGDAFDVYKEAVARRNPGAAALFDPQPQP